MAIIFGALLKWSLLPFPLMPGIQCSVNAVQPGKTVLLRGGWACSRGAIVASSKEMIFPGGTMLAFMAANCCRGGDAASAKKRDATALIAKCCKGQETTCHHTHSTTRSPHPDPEV